MQIVCRRCHSIKLLCSGCSKPTPKLRVNGAGFISCTNQDCHRYQKIVPEANGGVKDIICLSCVTEQAAQDAENKGEAE